MIDPNDEASKFNTRGFILTEETKEKVEEARRISEETLSRSTSENNTTTQAEQQGSDNAAEVENIDADNADGDQDKNQNLDGDCDEEDEEEAGENAAEANSINRNIVRTEKDGFTKVEERQRGKRQRGSPEEKRNDKRFRDADEREGRIVSNMFKSMGLELFFK